MIERLGTNLQVRIPYKTIFKSQRYLLRRLYDSLSTGHNYIGECKMSQRMTYIMLAFMFGLVEEPNKNKVYYVCESKARALEVREMALQLRDFYKKFQFTQPQSFQPRTSIQSLDRDFALQKSQIVLLHNFFHKQQNLLKDYPNDKYICIMSIKQYFTQIIQQKVHHKGTHSVKADYMLMETVAYDQIVETCISGWVNEVVIRRAFIEHKKIETYYHQRDDRRRLGEREKEREKGHVSNNNGNSNSAGNSNSNGLGSKALAEPHRLSDSYKRMPSSSSIDRDPNPNNPSNLIPPNKQSNSKSHSIFHNSHHHSTRQPQHQQKQWNITQIQKRIQQIYMVKKQHLLKQGHKHNPNEIEEEKVDPMKRLAFQEEALMALETVGYLVNFFQNYQVVTRQSNKAGKDEVASEEAPSGQVIEEMEKKMMVKRDKLKRLYPIFKKLIETYPPLVHPESYLQSNMLFRKGRNHRQPYLLSTRHILQLTKFVKDLIEYHQTFDEKYSECIEVKKSCYKERDRPSFFEVKFRCLKQPLLTEMILEFNQNFVVLMNNGISLQFYNSIFKPKLLMSEVSSSIIEQEHCQTDKTFRFSFDAPTIVADHIFNNIYGLNVTITPSQDSLKIPDFTSKDDAQHDSLIVKAYGVLLYDLSEIISDGIVVYFPNMSTITKFKQEWTRNEDIFKKINQVKRVFEESELEEENLRNVEEYKKVCDIGRGGIYFVAANGGMAKYTQFYGHYSRCVVFVGIPKAAESKRKQHLTQKQRQQRKKKELYFNLKETQLQTFYYLKTSAKCISNCINCNLQPKSVIFADVSYNKQSTKKWFPFIQEGSLNTSEVIDKVKKFHQHMEKRYEEGVQWEVGRVVRKRSFGKGGK